MVDVQFLTVGRFGKLCGLSTHTLRHYDDVGLLAPVRVDAASGYRYYQRNQVALARLIAQLRYADVPIEDIRRVLADPDGAEARNVLSRHRRRLASRQGVIGNQIRDIDNVLAKGVTVPENLTYCRPCQIKIAVDDVASAVAFYQEAFGFKYDVTRRAGDDEFSGFIFGTYGDADFFLIFLLERKDNDLDTPGASTFGLLVPDLDETHARALAAGATEAVAVHNPEGMPRCSAVKDPSGNFVWLYQG